MCVCVCVCVCVRARAHACVCVYILNLQTHYIPGEYVIMPLGLKPKSLGAKWSIVFDKAGGML